MGEDKDRLGGLVRFKVLSTPLPLPACWPDLASDFPLQAGWLRADAGADGLAAWFGQRETGALEQEILGRALQETAARFAVACRTGCAGSGQGRRGRCALAGPVRPRLPLSANAPRWCARSRTQN